MDIFDSKDIKPMLIAEIQKPFDSSDYIYELKLDGERCIAYLDKNSTVLQNKRNFILNRRFPELNEIHSAAKVKCILDGEIAILVDDKPDFLQVQRRSLMTNPLKTEMLASRYPASFTAFDILYYQDHLVTDLPLMERKKLLSKAMKENDRIAISRYVEQQGVAFYKLAEQNELEGIVAKRKDSRYFPGTRTKNWIKFKRLFDDDFVVCGYIRKNTGTSIILGQYRGDKLNYKGHVSSGVSSSDFQKIIGIQHSECPFDLVPRGNDSRKMVKRMVGSVRKTL